MTIDPISAVLGGVLLGSENFDGAHPWKVSVEDIINACTCLVQDYGIKLKSRGVVKNNCRFHLGGDDEFSYSNSEDEEGNPVVLIQLVES